MAGNGWNVTIQKLNDLALIQDEIPGTVRAHYSQLNANAADCIGCRSCESRCPFHVPVVDMMQKAKELMEGKS